MQGEHRRVNAKNTKIKPASLLSIPSIILPKSKPHVKQNSEDAVVVEILVTLFDMIENIFF